ncbi:hypothetical protein VTN77DRAFT_6735 [Rasamsonia byssochlamydoides]|uniref:uncharacterized protein n=1 Tax=Rasamsonia byssochlamydoides TaxID=89139 RepID=UPI003744558C
MDVFYAYTYGTGSWLTIQGLALITAPKLIVTMLRDEARPPSDIELYFSRCFGFGLLTIAVLTVLLTGSIPLTSTVAEPVSPEETDPKAPYAVPMVLVTSVFHATCASYDYAWYTVNGQTALAIGMLGSGAIASVGLWCLLFGSSGGRISKMTGADKRTWGFPFKNAEADGRSPEKKGL